MNIFSHSGKLGDIIYSLPTVRALGGGRYVVKRNGIMPDDQAEMLLPLLAMQPYVTGVGRDGDATHDFDVFRRWGPVHRGLLTHHHARPFMSSPPDIGPWLTPGRDWERGKYERTIVARSERYQSPCMNWDSVLSRIKNPVFVGTSAEHAMFPVGIPRLRLTDHVALARAIYESTDFIGNQSFPLSIAVGFGIPCHMELAPDHTNCNYPGVVYA